MTPQRKAILSVCTSKLPIRVGRPQLTVPLSEGAFSLARCWGCLLQMGRLHGCGHAERIRSAAFLRRFVSISGLPRVQWHSRPPECTKAGTTVPQGRCAAVLTHAASWQTEAISHASRRERSMFACCRNQRVEQQARLHHGDLLPDSDHRSAATEM